MFVAAAGAAMLIFNSCKKEEVDNETQSVVDNAVSEQEFMRISPTVNGRAINNPGVKKLIAGITAACPNVTITGDTSWTNPNDPPTMTMNYNPACTDPLDGRTRSGEMICSFSKPFDSIGCVITVNFNNYYSNGNKYEGTVKITRLAANSFNTKVIGGKCSGSNWTVYYDCDRTLTMTSGFNTPTDDSDDVFTLSGSANGTNRNGKKYSVVITSDLVKATSCKWIQSGEFQLTPDGLATRIVNYGSGACDNKATFTVNGNTFEFTMN